MKSASVTQTSTAGIAIPLAGPAVISPVMRQRPGFGGAYELYADKVIPKIGKAVAGDEESYRYLVESIRRFPKPDAFRAMVAEAGFANARADPMLGGLVCIWSGWKI